MSVKSSCEGTLKQMETTEKELGPEYSTIASPEAAVDGYPDGGLRAWLIVFGATCNIFSTFGFVNAWGVFQTYYQTDLLRNSSPSSIAWIGSVQYALVFLPGLVGGRLFDIGHFRIPFVGASILLVLATFLVGECTEYWHFLLCQGFAVGMGCGTLFAPNSAIIAHWFKKRRGFALGIAAVGSSLGGTIFPIAARSLIPRVGFPWTMRIFGFILIVTVGLANLTLRRRLPPTNVPGGLFNFAAFKSMPFSIYCVSAFVAFLGLYTVLTYIDVSATVSLGPSSQLAFYLVAIANASSGFGRYFSGLISDRTGSLNIMIPMTAATGLVTYAWPFAETQGSLIAVAVLYGFSVGTYVALLVNPMMSFGPTEDVGRRAGMFMTILAAGAVIGPPISGAISKATGGFRAVGYFAGSMVLLSVALMFLVRHLALGQIRGKA